MYSIINNEAGVLQIYTTIFTDELGQMLMRKHNAEAIVMESYPYDYSSENRCRIIN